MVLRETFDPVWEKSVPKGEAGKRWASRLFGEQGYKVVPSHKTYPWPKAVNQPYDLTVTFKNTHTVEVTHDVAAPFKRRGLDPHLCFQTEEMGKPAKVAGKADLYAHIIGNLGPMWVWDRGKLLINLQTIWKEKTHTLHWDAEMGTARAKGLRVPMALLDILGGKVFYALVDQTETKKQWTATEAIAAGDDVVADYVMGKI